MIRKQAVAWKWLIAKSACQWGCIAFSVGMVFFLMTACVHIFDPHVTRLGPDLKYDALQSFTFGALVGVPLFAILALRTPRRAWWLFGLMLAIYSFFFLGQLVVLAEQGWKDLTTDILIHQILSTAMALPSAWLALLVWKRASKRLKWPQ